jgi:hypothetical protein
MRMTQKKALKKKQQRGRRNERKLYYLEIDD